MSIDLFKPDIWSMLILRQLFKSNSIWRLFNNDYEGDIKESGGTVKITSLDDIATRPYPASADITYDPLTGTQQLLTTDQEDYWGIELEDIDALQAKVLRNPTNEVIMKAAKAFELLLNTFSITTLQAGVSTSAPDHSFDGGAALTLDHFKDQKTLLDLQDVPESGRFVLMDPRQGRQLLDIPQVINADQSGLGSTALTKGFIGELEGFAIIQTNQMITTDTNTKRPVLFTYEGAMTVAVAKNAQMEALRAQGRFKDLMRALMVFGAKVTRPEGLTEVKIDV